MSSPSAHFGAAGLAMHEGRWLFSAVEAMLKGIFEADREVALITGPERSLPGLFDMARHEPVMELLRKHGTALLPTPSARRGLRIALRRAKAGDCVFSFVPNTQLHIALGELDEAGSLVLTAGLPLSASGEPAGESSGALCLILEDDPRSNATLCPRQAARRVGLACIEPATMSQLRDAMDQAVRLSRAGGCAVGIVVHHLLLRSLATLEARPNRVAGVFDATLLRRKRRQRRLEGGGVLRMARRMEINRLRALPSPGERVPVGFITVGPADVAMQHLMETLRLRGRVSVLQLGLLAPIDEVLLERFLTRCERVVVLEPRPGSVHEQLLAAAESMRQRGVTPAAIWGRMIPPSGDDDSARPMQIDEAVHISTLARRIIHLLHPLRPALQVATRLTASPPELPHRPAPRGEGIGPSAAYAALRRILADADQRLRMEAANEGQALITTLAINGQAKQSSGERAVPVEICSASEFQDVGEAIISQAAATGGAYIVAVLDLDGERGEVERLVRAHVTPTLAERVNIVSGDLHERVKLRDRIVDAARVDHLAIVVVRDGRPPRFSLTGIERALTDTDQLGFEPRQWLIRPADEVCLIRDHLDGEAPPVSEAVFDLDGAASDLRRMLDDSKVGEAEADAGLPSAPQELDSIMRTRYTVEKLSKRQSSRVRVKVQPLLEQIEVIRTKPPAWVWRTGRRQHLELPTPQHAKQSVWRIHIAGWRGSAPGIAAMVLCEAGRNMGYEVSAIHEPAFIGAGCRAWSQVLYTRGSSDSDLTQTPLAPFGEADVLLGMDWQETLRGIDPRGPLQVAHPDRTGSIVNSGPFQADVRAAPTTAERAGLIKAIHAVSRDECCVVQDYAAACRTWFYTDRITDLAMLGSAFQRGLVPVRLDAIEAALKRLEASGYGRSLEAFDFGRSLAADDRLLPGRKQHGELTEDLSRITRRMVLSVQRSRWGGRSLARNFQRLLEQCIVSTPGLSETAAGRQAQRDMVAALYRCLEWGGIDYANKYGQLLMALYRADRGETGRTITRDAVLPLAEAMLVRDQVYIACMAASPEQRRRLQSANTAARHGGGLNVKRARGDRIERRYLTRMELIAFNRRYRLDLRTSDWLARVAKASRILLPHAWRGSRRDRELRRFMIDFVQRATHGCSHNYDAWAESMHRLHHHAVEQRLRSMAVSEIRMLTGAADQVGPETSAVK